MTNGTYFTQFTVICSLDFVKDADSEISFSQLIKANNQQMQRESNDNYMAALANKLNV